MSGFGMATIKQEGMCSSYEDPEMKPWDGCETEFKTYFKNQTHYHVWWKWFFKRAIKQIAVEAWSQALFINAKKTNLHP